MIFGKHIEIIDKLLNAKLISESDTHIAEFLSGLSSDLNEDEKTVFALFTALISRSVNDGVVSICKNDFDEFAENIKITDLKISLEWENSVQTMQKSSLCTTNPLREFKPIVFINDRFYFYKYWHFEFAIASDIVKIAKRTSRYRNSQDELNAVFEKIFDKFPEQMNAAKKVSERAFLLISGGPGTGKTTTIAGILTGILTLFPHEKIALTAFTGKAATRMSEALKNAAKNIGTAAESHVSETISSLGGTTIHRLLNYKHGQFNFNREKPLDAGIIIVDEAGMIDSELFSALLNAVGDETSLILLGDKEQLPSVGTGSVFNDLCTAAKENILPPQVAAKLETSHRFSSDSGIGRVAKAINEQKSAAEIIEICRNENSLNFIPIKNQDDLMKEMEKIALNYRFLFNLKSTPAEITEELSRFKLLAPSKEDSCGVNALNKMIEFFLDKNDAGNYYNGRPVMVTKNDYKNNLFNGDCGVILERNGRKSAYFSTNSSAEPTNFNIYSLSSIETVYASTIHKSQGSEYDSVAIVLPENEMPVLTKELLYTAVTRAKKEVTIIGRESVLDYTVKRNTERNSGFKKLLENIVSPNE